MLGPVSSWRGCSGRPWEAERRVGANLISGMRASRNHCDRPASRDERSLEQAIDLDALIAVVSEERSEEKGVPPAPVVSGGYCADGDDTPWITRCNQDQRASESLGEDTGKRLEITRPLCVKCSAACSCGGDCGRCSPGSRSFLPGPAAARARAGLHLDAGCAPAGSAPIRSWPGSEHLLVAGGGFRVGAGPGVAYPKSRCFGV
jgi:hypothetical protein